MRLGRMEGPRKNLICGCASLGLTIVTQTVRSDPCTSSWESITTPMITSIVIPAFILEPSFTCASNERLDPTVARYPIQNPLRCEIPSTFRQVPQK